MTTNLKSPFPYMGGKSRPVSMIWERLGTQDIYSEPFAGSLAVLLAKRGGMHKREIVNDLDCLLVNFWRSVRFCPEETAENAIRPTNQVDLEAGRRYLSKMATKIELENMLEDVEYCDPQVAGWWVWVVSNEIAMNMNIGSHFSNTGINLGSVPSMDNTPGTGHGVQLQKQSSKFIHEIIQQLSVRLRKVIAFHGNWRTCVSNTKLGQAGKSKKYTASVFLDPPYSTPTRGKLYAKDSKVIALDALAWCKEHQDNPRLHIALCGLEGEYDLPGWDAVPWVEKDYNIMGGKTKPSDRGEHTRIETIWFSPHCLLPSQQLRMT